MTDEETAGPGRRHPHARCEECPLQHHGLFVPSSGPAQADVAFIGEAAGKQEVNLGKPFMGASGKLLNQVLSHHGIERRNVFLSNATLCRPPGQENVSPPPEAVRACRPRLIHELQEHGTKTVVALGNFATQSLLSTGDGVTKARVGLGHTSPHLEGVRVLATFHPAACLRSPDFFPSMVKDIGKIKREPVPWEEPKFAVYDDVDRACAVLRELRHLPEKRLVIDIETDVDKEDAYDHPNNYELLCIGLGYAKKRVVVIGRNALKDPVVLKLLGELLHAKELSAQNGKYDLKGLFPRIGPLGLSFDTMLASYACDERRGIHSLGTQGVEIIGTPDWKDVLEPYNPKKLGYGVIPPDVLHKYNAFDVAVTWELQDYYEEVFTEDERRVHDFLVAASNELQYVELNGIAIDLEYNTELMVKYLEVIADVRQQIIETIDDPDWSGFNPNSPKQVKEVIKGVFGINIPKKRNQQGQMAESTDEETLLLLREKCKPDTRPYLFFTRMLKHRREAKLYGTYVKGIRQRLYRGRVYSTFLLHGSTSGRLASRNPNVQNIPRESIIRDQFVPSRPDRVFVQVDYSQAELRVLTWLAQEDYFRDIFNDPTRDLFNELGPVLYGDVFNILDKAAKKEKRIRIKGYVYGLAYGREAGSIAEEFGIPYWEAQEGMDRFFGVIPNIVSYQKGVEERIRNLDDLVTPFGRHRRFYLLTPETIKTNIKEGLSFEPQSTSSDICLQAFVWSRQELKGKAWIRNLVHDSILAECQRGDEDYVAGVLNRNMLKSAKTVVGDYVRFATETTVGSKWGDL